MRPRVSPFVRGVALGPLHGRARRGDPSSRLSATQARSLGDSSDRHPHRPVPSDPVWPAGHTMDATANATCRESREADARIRTGDPFITSEVLWPAELRRRARASIGPLCGCFGRARRPFPPLRWDVLQLPEETLARIATGRRMRPLTVLLGIALIALLAGTVSPAMGGPTATRAAAGALAKAKRALASRSRPTCARNSR